MAYILVVEDSPDQALVIAGLLQAAGYRTKIAENGAVALSKMAGAVPDLVVTDLVMPELDGLQLVQQATKAYPGTPIILVTAYGSAEIAMRALREGAASFVPKDVVAEQLVETVRKVLELSQAKRERQRLLCSLIESRSRFVLENDTSLVPPLISYIQETVSCGQNKVGETELMRVGLALHEALINAMHHGNLEVGSELRRGSGEAYRKLLEERLQDPKYRDRRVSLTVEMSHEQLKLIVLDEGNGFNLSAVPDPTDAQNLIRLSGRGLYLIKTFMSEAFHNDRGNEVTLIMRFAPNLSTASV
jgi:CheY-like chemotaxis protein/anti-sigma regulatory factor (Ser/Thr protein kinase)